MASYAKLLEGYKAFRSQYLSQENSAWLSEAKEGQSPKVMIIACSDSRVNPAIITRASLGDIFVVNNVANLVPPYHESGNTHHSTSAAIEFAVIHLKVEHIVIMGHSGCGGIRALMADHDNPKPENPEPAKHYSFIRPWMQIVDDAAVFTDQEKAATDTKSRAKICEQRASLISLKNLVTFPWVKEAMTQDRLKIHAWHYDIGEGRLLEYNETSEKFKELT
ncbi:Carbonic anhydrase, beta class [hydrothermal vent metagenome]|uniref:carbonic anhydrase n=1 Tax=hydrothermal vent metagenome TaxID=652676 RepID=A0A3B1AZM2_9ZZZZ